MRPGVLFCCCDLVASYFLAPLSAKMLTFASWTVKHICFVRFHFLLSFFASEFSFKPLQFTVNSCAPRLSLQRGAHFDKNLIIYIGSGTIFSRRPTLGRFSLERGANSTFSIFVFIFFQKWVWRQLHTLSLCTPLWKTILWANTYFYLENLMVLLKTINFTKGIWYFSSLVGLWGASGVSGVLLGIFSGFLRLGLWPWKLSGILFGCIWACFHLLSKRLDIPWTHVW